MRSITRLTLLFSLFTLTASSQTARISGKILNETTKKPVRADWIVLVKTGQGLETLKQLDNVSEFNFSDIPLMTSAPYMVRAFYKGVLYSQTIRVAEARPYALDVVVYESSSQWSKMALKVPHMIVARSGNHLEIEQTWNIVNSGNMTFNTPDGKSPTLFVTKPISAQVASVTTSHNESLPIPASPFMTDTSLSINFPFRPGTTQVQINYSIPYAGTANWSFRANHKIDEFRLFVTPKDIQVESPLLNHMHDAALEEQNFSAYAADGVEKTILISFSGGSSGAADPGGKIMPDSNSVQSRSLTIIPFLIALLLIPLYVALTRPVISQSKESLITEIAALDDAHIQNSTDPAYLKKRSELKRTLYNVLLAEAK